MELVCKSANVSSTTHCGGSPKIHGIVALSFPAVSKLSKPVSKSRNPIVGGLVGYSVRMYVGEIVGFDDGERTGLIVGGSLGDFVGSLLGDNVGSRVGLEVGSLVGVDVGSMVGLEVGLATLIVVVVIVVDTFAVVCRAFTVVVADVVAEDEQVSTILHLYPKYPKQQSSALSYLAK